MMSDMEAAVDGKTEQLPSAGVAGAEPLASPQTPTAQTRSLANLPTRFTSSSAPTSPTIRHSPRIQHKMSAPNAEAGPSNSTPRSPLRATASGQPPVPAVEAPPAPTYLQPAEFSSLHNGVKPTGASTRRWEALIDQPDALLSPEDDPMALRGIPIFRPSIEEFQDFEGYMNKTVPWGMRSGIAKIIPPQEWIDNLPAMDRRTLSEVRIKNPIQQNMMGKAGVFRAQNIEKNKNRPLTVHEWFNKCSDPKWATPPVKIVERGSKEAKALNEQLMREKKEAAARKKEEWRSRRRSKAAEKEVKVEEEAVHDSEASDAVPALDHSSSGSTHSTPDPATKTPEADDIDPWYKSVDLTKAWLPISTELEDFTDEACFAMQERFWKNLGFGEPSWYGADLMQGSLFADPKTPWNVAHLPNLLDRIKCLVPGVNEPYLYFGMWRAAFAWHVEDMDLFSINYIHFGAPKYWYAIPQDQAELFERRMAERFAPDAKVCDQFLRHKSFAISPTQLENWGIRANMLVHKQGEFVVTYPRGYHAGFNMGFNCAESVNFALDSWIELGRKARYCQCVSHSVRIDVDKMLADAEDALAQPEGVYNPKKREHRGEEGETPSKKPRKRAKKVHVVGEDGNVTSHAVGPAEVSSSDDVIRIKLDSSTGMDSVAQVPVKRPRGRPKKVKAAANAPAPVSADTATDSPLMPVAAQSRPIKLVISKPKQTLPCLFCPGQDTSDLLQVFDPSPQDVARSKSGTMPLRVHLSCAQAIPEIYIEDIDLGEGIIQKMVTSTFEIDKARWNLKCICCSDKSTASMGVKIQCSKGKCPKAMHVSCAMASDQVSYVLREVDELADDPLPIDAPEDAVPTQSYIKTWQPFVLCPQHNPDVIEANKRQKAEELREKILALLPGEPIKLKLGSSFAITFVRALENEKLVEVQVAGAIGTSFYPWDKVDLRPSEEKVQENEYARVHVTSRRRDADEADRSGANTPLAANFVPTRYDPLERSRAPPASAAAAALTSRDSGQGTYSLDASQPGRAPQYPAEPRGNHSFRGEQPRQSQAAWPPGGPVFDPRAEQRGPSASRAGHFPYHGVPAPEHAVRAYPEPSHLGGYQRAVPPMTGPYAAYVPAHGYPAPPPHLPPVGHGHQLPHRVHPPPHSFVPHRRPSHSVAFNDPTSLPMPKHRLPPHHAMPMAPQTHHQVPGPWSHPGVSGAPPIASVRRP